MPVGGNNTVNEGSAIANDKVLTQAEGINVSATDLSRFINFIEGTGITLTLAEDVGNDRIDITIEATGGGGGAPQSGQSWAIGILTVPPLQSLQVLNSGGGGGGGISSSGKATSDLLNTLEAICPCVVKALISTLMFVDFGMVKL